MSAAEETAHGCTITWADPAYGPRYAIDGVRVDSATFDRVLAMRRVAARSDECADDSAARLLAECRTERDRARAIARTLAHAYRTDNRPPTDMIAEAWAFPVVPGP